MRDRDTTQNGSPVGRTLLENAIGIAIAGALLTVAVIVVASLRPPASKGTAWEDPQVQRQLVELRPTGRLGWPH